MTSKEGLLPNVPRMLFKAIKNLRLAGCQLQETLTPSFRNTPKYFNSLTQSRLDPLTDMGAHLSRKRGPILRQHDLAALICKSNSLKIELLLFVRACKSETEMLSNNRSSAYKKLFTQSPFTKQPILESSNEVKTEFTYDEKSKGEIIPPCLTPAVRD